MFFIYKSYCFSALREFLNLLGSPSSSLRIFSPHNQLLAHKTRTLKFCCSPWPVGSPSFSIIQNTNHNFQKRALFCSAMSRMVFKFLKEENQSRIFAKCKRVLRDFIHKKYGSFRRLILAVRSVHAYPKKVNLISSSCSCK